MMTVPGFVDTHVHFREPGQTHKEDISSGARAAVMGGYTSVVMMGNTVPHPDNVETLGAMLEKGRQTPIHVYCCGNVTVGMLGKELTDMAALKAAGAVVFSDDGLPVMDEALFRRACECAAALKVPISLHEEDPAYIDGAGVNAGSEAAKRYGIPGADRKAEITMVERDIRIAVDTGAEVIFQHISCAESVDLIRDARKTHQNIHAEATPHHFTLTEDAVLTKGTNAKVNPPLRKAADREAIRQGLADGTIEIIATDHAPHTAEEKERDFAKAPSGMIGLETALALGIRELVKGGYLSMEQLIACMTEHPARILGLPLPAGDTVTFDPEGIWQPWGFHSKSSNSPFLEEMLPGSIHRVTVGGNVIYSRE